MTFELAAFLRTTLPLDLGRLAAMDSGRYHSIWLPDHLVSFWPDAIWTPEFTDLAEVSHSPHRHLDAFAIAGSVASLTERAAIATSVVDTVRRHPVMLAQSAVTLSHLSGGRFILGLGSGERENTVPYGFDFAHAVDRFEEALQVIRLLWATDGPVDFDGAHFRLHEARLDAELHDGCPPPIWIGANGPRMLAIAGRHADGWWPTGSDGPEEYAAKLALVRRAAEQAGRDPLAIAPAKMIVCLLGEADEIAEMLERPLVKSLVLQLTAESLRVRGHQHPMGERWRGIQDIQPDRLPRERLLQLFVEVDGEAILSVVPHGTPKEVARDIAAFHEAGLQVASVLDYSGMAGQAFAARSADKVRETEDEVMRLIGERG
ncbi:MAG: LLM class flavin-dependent oxidoreductase [Acidimicrobiia bacterium]|nr:LLM class flavin-dependent oxidoreductase [Acidimicrobiia bacterium]